MDALSLQAGDTGSRRQPEKLSESLAGTAYVDQLAEIAPSSPLGAKQ